MATENERQWLIKYLPDNLSDYPYVLIRQGYLSIADNGDERRIRHEDDECIMMEKKGRGQKREESDIQPITKGRFEAFWPETRGKRIRKTRYRIPYGKATIELDIYWAPLAGLIVAEVEFAADEEARAFVPPDWFGPEVTDDRRYTDQFLAVYGKPSPVFFSSTDEAPVFDLEIGVKKLVECIKEDHKTRFGASTIVLAGGGSSTGKTTIVKAVQKALRSRSITSVVISADNYSKGKKWKKAERARGNILTWDDPEIYDYRELFRDDLPELLSGSPITAWKFDFEKTCERKRKGRHHQADVIFIEGLHVLDDEWADYGHIRIFMDASMHGRMIRRLMRDVKRTPLKPHEILEMFLGVVEPKHREFVEPTRKNADFIIRSEYAPEVEAKRCQDVLRQMKFRAESGERVAEAVGGVRIGERIGWRDRYFCPFGCDIHKTGELIRIRKDSFGSDAEFTYKGPKTIVDGVTETPLLPIRMGRKTEEAFYALYGRETVIIHKLRTWYWLDGIAFSVDTRVTKIADGRSVLLGNFIEVAVMERTKKRAIKKALRKLGLNPADAISQSYFEMHR